MMISLIPALVFSGCRNTSKPDKQERTGNTIENGTMEIDGKPLHQWEITNFGTQGPVQVSGDEIVLGMGDGLTGVTWAGDFPVMNYEVELDAQKISGNDFFCGLTFPVDTTFCSLIVGGWGGPVVGLSTIDNRDASENSTKTLMRFEKDTWYHIRLRVVPEKIEAWVDQEKVVDFNFAGHRIFIRPEVGLSRPFGIASWTTTAAIKNIQVKTL